MTARAHQEVLARLLVDRAFRRRVRDDAAGAWDGAALSDAERCALMALDPRRVDAFADMIERGRAALFFSAVPPAALETTTTDEGYVLAASYADAFPERGLLPWRACAARFYLWLEAHGPPAFAALCQVERLRLVLKPRAPRRKKGGRPTATSRPRLSAHVALVEFPTDVVALLSARARGEKAPALAAAPGPFLVRMIDDDLAVEAPDLVLCALAKASDGTRKRAAVLAEAGGDPHLAALRLRALLKDGTIEWVDVMR